MLPIALLLALAAPSDAPVSDVAYVSLESGKCVYQTGDVLMNAKQFEEDLKVRFDRPSGLIIYHDPGVPASCLDKARRIARHLGFTPISIEMAPRSLDMGPPRQPVSTPPSIG